MNSKKKGCQVKERKNTLKSCQDRKGNGKTKGCQCMEGKTLKKDCQTRKGKMLRKVARTGIEHWTDTWKGCQEGERKKKRLPEQGKRKKWQRKVGTEIK